VAATGADVPLPTATGTPAARPTHDGPLTMRTAGRLYLDRHGGLPVTTDLIYRPRDCFAVNLLLRGPDGVEVGWTFAWRLLAQGLHALAGDGDIPSARYRR
jgi:hypothetical protein